MNRRGALVEAEAEREAHRVLVVAVEADTVVAVEAEAVTPVVAADTEVTANFRPAVSAVRLQSFLPSARSRPSRRIRAFFLLGTSSVQC